MQWVVYTLKWGMVWWFVCDMWGDSCMYVCVVCEIKCVIYMFKVCDYCIYYTWEFVYLSGLWCVYYVCEGVCATG